MALATASVDDGCRRKLLRSPATRSPRKVALVPFRLPESILMTMKESVVENPASGDRGKDGELRRNVVVLENSVALRRPRAEVFDYCSDIRNEHEWNPTMRSVELLTPGPLRVGSVYRARWKGGPANTLQCVQLDRPTSWVHYSESKMWRVRFEGLVRETADGSRLLTRMEISPVGLGKLFTPVFRLFMARQERANMHHIRRALEAGSATNTG